MYSSEGGLGTVQEALTAADVNGNLEVADTGMLRGWACRKASALPTPNTPSKPLWVHLYDETGGGSTYLGSTTANTWYRDVASSCGAQNLASGFAMAMPQLVSNGQLQPPGDRTIRAYLTDWNEPSPNPSTWVALNTRTYKHLLENPSPGPKGYVEVINNQQVSGWACAPQDTSITVELWLQYHGVGQPRQLGRTATRLPRPDTAGACLTSANGFEFGFPVAIPGGKHNIYVRAVSSANEQTTLLETYANGLPVPPALVTFPYEPPLVPNPIAGGKTVSLTHAATTWIGDGDIGSGHQGDDANASTAAAWPPCEGSPPGNTPCCDEACPTIGECRLRGHQTIADGTCVPSGSQFRSATVLAAGTPNTKASWVTCLESGEGCLISSPLGAPWRFQISDSDDEATAPSYFLDDSGAWLTDPTRVRYGAYTFADGQGDFELQVDTWTDPHTTPVLGNLQRCDKNSQRIATSPYYVRDNSSTAGSLSGFTRRARTLNYGVWAEVELSVLPSLYRFEPTHNADGSFGTVAGTDPPLPLPEGWRDGTTDEPCGIPGFLACQANGRFYTPYTEVVVGTRVSLVDCLNGVTSPAYIPAYPGICHFDLNVVPFWDTGYKGGTSSYCNDGNIPQYSGDPEAPANSTPYIMKPATDTLAAYLPGNLVPPNPAPTYTLQNSLSSGGANLGRMALGERRFIAFPIQNLLIAAFPNITTSDWSKLEPDGISVGIEGWGQAKNNVTVHRVNLKAPVPGGISGLEVANGALPASWVGTCTINGVPCAQSTTGFSEAPSVAGRVDGTAYQGTSYIRLNTGVQTTNPSSNILAKLESPNVSVRGFQGKTLAVTSALRYNIQSTPASANAQMTLEFLSNSTTVVATHTKTFEEGGFDYFRTERIQAVVPSNAVNARWRFTAGGDTNKVVLDVDNISFAAVETCPGLDDSNPCTIDSCNAEGQAVHQNAAEATVCSDGNPCNGTETCNWAGFCQPGAPLVAAGDVCKTCNTTTGAITNAANTVMCNDNNVCTTNDKCNGSGVCVGLALVPILMSDDNICTHDSCNLETGITHEPEGFGFTCGMNMQCNGAGACEPYDPNISAPLTEVDAPDLPPTIGVSFEDQYSFLYEGTDGQGTGAIQVEDEEDPQPIVIDPDQVSLLSGTVLTDQGGALPSATVSIKDHPEFGQTDTRADGHFDIAVNGGQTLTLVYDRPGSLPSHRKVRPGINEVRPVDDVVLIPPSDLYTNLDLCDPNQSCDPALITVVSGEEVIDDIGARTTRLFIPSSLDAKVIRPGQPELALDGIVRVRVTEYTDNDNGGPAAMPAELPFGVQYTFAVELNIDGVNLADGETVRFGRWVNGVWTEDTKLSVYVDNYRNFPIGTQVPVGYYDRATAAWIPDPGGVVLNVLGVDGSGLAILDIDGVGTGHDTTLSDSLGITNDERRKLAQTYATQLPKQLVRFSTNHFTPYDCNFPGGPPKCEDGGPCPDDVAAVVESPEPEEVNCEAGSIIECEPRSVGEVVEIAGAPFTLNYRSRRAPGYKRDQLVEIDFPPCTADRHYQRTFTGFTAYQYGGGLLGQAGVLGCTDRVSAVLLPPTDGFGRPMYGTQRIHIDALEIYPTIYSENGGGFGSGPTGTIGGIYGDGTKIHRYFQKVVTFSSPLQGDIGGWTFDGHHQLDAHDSVIELGNGTKRSLSGIPGPSLSWFGGDGGYDLTGDGGNVKDAGVAKVGGVAFGPDGYVYIGHSDVGTTPGYIRRISPEGIITRFSTMTVRDLHRLKWGYDGNLYALGGGFAENGSSQTGGNTIVRITPDSACSVNSDCPSNACVNTNGESRCVPGWSVVAQQVWGYPSFQDFDVWVDGTIYIGVQNAILKKAPNWQGQVGPYPIYAGGFWTENTTYTDAFGTQVAIPHLSALALGPDGAIYYMSSKGWGTSEMDNQINKLGDDGMVRRVVGGGSEGIVDGKKARDILLSAGGAYYPPLRVDALGTIYTRTYMAGTGDAGTMLVKIGADGLIKTVVGGGQAPALPWDYVTDVPALGAVLTGMGSTHMYWFDVDSEGTVIAASGIGYPEIWKLSRIFTTGTEELAGPCPYVIPSADRTETYCFDGNGRHQSTKDIQTGATLETFGYNGSGQLSTVADASGNVTTIEFDGNGKPSAVVGPFGQRTIVAINADGYLKTVGHPDGTTDTFEYTSDGLITNHRDRVGGVSTYEYTSLGELKAETLPNSGRQTLSRSQVPGKDTVTFKSPLGRQKTFVTMASGTDTVQQKSQGPATSSTRLAVRTTTSSSGSKTVQTQDGVVRTSTVAADPIYGMMVPYTSSETVAIPGVPTLTANAVLTSDATKDETVVTLSGATQAFTDNYEKASKKRTVTTFAGRKFAAILDTRGRISALQETDLAAPPVAPKTFLYEDDTQDDNGRLTEIAQGTRRLKFDYHPTANDAKSGQLWHIQAGFVSAANVFTATATKGLIPDHFGRILEETFGGSLTTMTWDGEDRLASLTPPGKPVHSFAFTQSTSVYDPPSFSSYTPDQLRTTWTSNLDRQLDLVTLPAGKSIDFKYDSATNRLNSVVLDNASITLTYWDAPTCPADELCTCTAAGCSPGRPETITRTNAAKVDLQYAGHLVAKIVTQKTGTEAALATSTLEKTFTSRQQVDSETLTVPGYNAGNGVRSAFGYDADGFVTCVQQSSAGGCDPAAANALVLKYEGPNGRLSQMKLGRTTEDYTYNTYGELASTVATFPSGITLKFTYDNGATKARDPLGRVEYFNIEYAGQPYGERRHVYENGRLKDVYETSSAGNAELHYGYDANGNRNYYSKTSTDGTTKTIPTSAITYNNQDALTTYDGLQYTYDARGSLSSVWMGIFGTNTYAYDALGNLTKVQFQNGTIIDYVIDGLGRRVGKKVNGTMTQQFVWDGSRLIAELDSAGTFKSRFWYASQAHSPDFMERSGKLYRFFKDQTGTPIAIVDVNPASGEQELYEALVREPFGYFAYYNPVTPIGFAGGLFDNDTRLLRFGARDYDANLGRWLTKDPILFDGGQANLYVYASNDPINYIDTEGEIANFIIGAGIGAGIDLGFQLWNSGGNFDCIDWGDVAIAGAVGAVGGGLIGRSGLRVSAGFYEHGGAGINLLKNGKRIFGLDWHKFKLGQKMVNRPHVHFGKTAGQLKKHRPWQQPGGGGLRLPWD